MSGAANIPKEDAASVSSLREALANLCDEIDRHIDAAPDDRKPVFRGIAAARAALSATQPATEVEKISTDTEVR